MTPKLAIEPYSPVSNAKNQTRESGTVLLGWLRIFSRHYRYAMEKDDLPIYAEALCDLTAEQIDAACKSALKTCRFWPTVADIRAQLDQAGARGFELEAEGEWQKLLTWISENFFPDTGIRRGAPRLAPAIEHAAKAAGGFPFIERCSQEQLVWCRKNFLSAYKNVHETGQVENLLGDGEAKEILGRLANGTPRPGHKALTGGEKSPVLQPAGMP